MTTTNLTARQYFQNVLDAHISNEMDAMSAKYIAGLNAHNSDEMDAMSAKYIAGLDVRVEAVKVFVDGHEDEWFTRDQIAEVVVSLAHR